MIFRIFNFIRIDNSKYRLILPKNKKLGIIQKQASRTTLISFVGMGFAAFTRLAMPIVLHPAQIGLIGLLDLFSGYFVMIFNFYRFLPICAFFQKEVAGQKKFAMILNSTK